MKIDYPSPDNHISLLLTLQYTYQHMPDIFISSLETAETNADSKQALTSPHVARSDCSFSQFECLAAVDNHFNWFLHIGFQKIFKGIIIVILKSKCNIFLKSVQ